MTKTKQTILDRWQHDMRFRACPEGADHIKHHDREAVRSIIAIAGNDLIRVCPSSRELNHGLNKLEESLGWAHAAIDRYGDSDATYPETGL